MIASSAGSRRGPSPTRTAPQVTAAAIELADRGGLAAVTMRAVATAVGSAPAALYRYVASRDDLLRRMVESALAEVDLPAASGAIAAGLVALTRSQVAVLQRHPWLADALSVVPPGPAAIRILDAGLGVLEPVHAAGSAKMELLAMLTGVATLFARSGAVPAPGSIEALREAAGSHVHLAAAFATPGRPAPPDALLERTVRALAQALLDPTAG